MKMLADKNWETVEFRCMIQDILGNELYPKQTLHNTDSSQQFGDRTIYYCISIPGENDWVRNCPKGNKNEFMVNNYNNPASRDTPNGTAQSEAEVRQSSNNGHESDHDRNNRLSCTLVNWSYPIPSDGKNKSCLIKVYDNDLADRLRVNDIVHVYGLVEPSEFEDDSQLITNRKSSTPDRQQEATLANGDGAHNDEQAGLDSEFEPANDLPHRLVPRVHVKKLKKLNHINPLLPEAIARDVVDMTMLRLARTRLTTFFTQLFAGDPLPAEYLVLSLISKIHRRKDVTTLGQLTIGISGVKPGMQFLTEKLYEIIAKVTTHSHFLDLNLANLNNLCFTPKKDHENNKMIAGTLQLPDGLYLVLNETALSEGQLTVQGTENLRTLNHIIRWQRHNYDFKFHSVEIDTDLKILVISEGRSILTVPYDVKLVKTDPESIKAMKEACGSIDDFLTADLLNSFRYFITALHDVIDYKIPDEVQKRIQDDFVGWRTRDEALGKVLFSADDLSSYMTLARYMAISRGETSLTAKTWAETCEMESQRQARLS